MNILYLGDIYGRPGIEVVQKLLPELKKDKQVDFVIAQAENVSDGRGMTPQDMKTLQNAGVDFFTGGNWSLYREDLTAFMNDPNQPVLRPANYPEGTQGKGWKMVSTPKGKVLVISLLGSIVGKDANKPIDNPLKVIDEILEANKTIERVATVVNFHGDYSSEKKIIGYYLDGRVSVVIGDHWHTPTADAQILPKGTAHITDVGMCGTLHSSLGVKLSVVIPRWRDGILTKNELETEGPLQFNALFIAVDTKTGLSRVVTSIQKFVD